MFHSHLKRVFTLALLLLPIWHFSLIATTDTAAQTEPAREPALSQQSDVERVSLSGWFTIVWSDPHPESEQTPIRQYFLTQEDGDTFELLLDEETVESDQSLVSLNGTYVTIDGTTQSIDTHRSVRSTIHVDDMRAHPTVRLTATGAEITGSQPWITIMCKFADKTDEPEPPSYFEEMYRTTVPSLDDYWREVSYDRIDLLGSTAVSRWYTLPQPQSYYLYDSNGDGVADFDSIRAAEDCTAVADAEVDYPDYAGINLMFNSHLLEEGVAGRGGRLYMNLDDVSKPWRIAWLPEYGFHSMAVTAHELGHAFGLPHSSGQYGNTYDNRWDIMSGNGTCAIYDTRYGCFDPHTVAYHKDMLGWLSDSAVYTATEDSQATITLERLALPQTEAYRAAKIPIWGSLNYFYTVEARHQSGYDENLVGEAVIIHEVDTTRERPAQVIDIDGDGDTGDAGAMWEVGETFAITEPHRITVSVVSTTTTGFNVNIAVESYPTFRSPLLSLGHLDRSAHASDVQGEYAYVAAQESGLRIVDISDVNAPQEVATYAPWKSSSDQRTHDIAIKGSIAYLANKFGGLHIVDISNPSSPTEVKYKDAHYYPREITIRGDFAYIVDASDFVILDVSTPTQPVEVGRHSFDYAASTLALNGSYAYFVYDHVNVDGIEYASTLNILDISNPAAPVAVGSYELPAFTLGIGAAKQHVYVTTEDAGMYIVNVSDPSNPSLASTHDTSSPIHAVAVRDSLAYLTTGSAGVRLLDVSDPSTPKELGYFLTGNAQHVVEHNGTLVTANGEDGLRILRHLPTQAVLNYQRGAPGSSFVFTGENFPVNTAVDLSANGTPIGTVQSDRDGEFRAILTTDNADPGTYFVNAEAGLEAHARLEIANDAPIRDYSGDGLRLAVPAGIALDHSVYLPIVLH